jgi:mitogen-activated protein kinase kinase
MFKFNTYLR